MPLHQLPQQRWVCPLKHKVDPNIQMAGNYPVTWQAPNPLFDNLDNNANGLVDEAEEANSTYFIRAIAIDKAKNFEFFPNPAKEILNINLDSSITDFSFEVSDLNGRKIFSTKNQKQINTSQLKPGIHIGTLETEKGTVNKKLVVEAHAFSAGAKEAIEKAGGEVKLFVRASN